MNGSQKSFWGTPLTSAGKWSGRLIAAFVIMFILNVAVIQQFRESASLQNSWLNSWFLPGFVIVMLLCGLAGGIFGGIAILRWHEHSWVAWVGFLLGVMVLFLIISESFQYMRS